MRQAVIILLAVCVCVQRSIGFLPVKAGPADLLLGLIIAALAVEFLRRREKLSLPPWHMSLLLLMVMISSLAAAFTDPSKAIIKEGLQTIEVLVFGWMAAAFLFRKTAHARLFQRTVVAVCGVEALILCIRFFPAVNRFQAGMITVNRNGGALLLMLCAPLALIMAAEEDSRQWRALGGLVLFFSGTAAAAGGAVIAGLAGLGMALVLTRKRGRAVYALPPFILGVVILLIFPHTSRMTLSAVNPELRENFLIQNRNDEYEAEKEAHFEAHPRWFKRNTAMRYRRWGFTAQHAGHSARNLLIGRGPGSYNTALKPFAAAAGRPNINTDVVMMYNIGINEPDTYSAYGVQLTETGLAGLAGLLVFLIVPLIILCKKRRQAGPEQRAAAAALAGLIFLNVFFSHMVTGTYLLVIVLVYMTVGELKAETVEAGDE